MTCVAKALGLGPAGGHRAGDLILPVLQAPNKDAEED